MILYKKILLYLGLLIIMIWLMGILITGYALLPVILSFITLIFVFIGISILPKINLTGCILIGYYIFLAIVEYNEYFNHAIKRSANVWYLEAEVLQDTVLGLAFWFFFSIFFLLAVLTIIVHKQWSERCRFKIICPRVSRCRLIGNPIIFLGISVIVEILVKLEMKQGVDSVARFFQSHVGLTNYLFAGLTLWLFFLSLEFVTTYYSNRKKFYLYLGLCIIEGIPSLILGSKSPVFFNIIIVGLWLYALNPQAAKKLLRPSSGLIIALIMFATIQLGNYFRTGMFTDFLSLIFRRITGYPDGVLSLKYFLMQESPLGLNHYINIALGIDRSMMQITRYYTVEILGFPDLNVHSNALPGFCSSLIYGGYAGLVLYGILFPAYLCILENGIFNSGKSLFLKFMFSYLFCMSVFNWLLEGSIDSYKGMFAPLIMAGIMYNCVHIVFVRRKREGDNKSYVQNNSSASGTPAFVQGRGSAEKTKHVI